jgi:hypothetical protein
MLLLDIVKHLSNYYVYDNFNLVLISTIVKHLNNYCAYDNFNLVLISTVAITVGWRWWWSCMG